MSNFSSTEPYRCRLKYFWAGLRNAGAKRVQSVLQAPAKSRAPLGARLLAPYILLLALGPLVGLLARPFVHALHAIGSSRAAGPLLNLVLAGVLLLPFIAVLKLWQLAGRICYQGWELSHKQGSA